MKHTTSTLMSSFLIAILQLKVGPKPNEKMGNAGTIKCKFDSLKSICLFSVLIGIFFLACATTSHATTYEQTYYDDGADHFMSVYLTSGGMHTFFVNHVPWGASTTSLIRILEVVIRRYGVTALRLDGIRHSLPK